MRTFCSSLVLCLIALLSNGQGSLIGVTSNGGTDHLGVIFKTDFDGNNEQVLYEFRTPYPGRNPFGNIVEVYPGVFYGITYGGGPSDRGIIFSYTPQNSTFVKLVELKDLNLAGTVSSLVKGPDDKLYFSSSQSLYSYDPITNEAHYVTSTGGSIAGDPFFGSDGLLYGTATRYDLFSGLSTGFFFSYNLLTYQFNEIDFGNSLGYPTGTVMEASNGKIYGINYQAGNSNDGTIFEYNPTKGSLTSVATFSYGTPFQSRSSMIEAPNGKLYGVIASGGSAQSGAIFEFDPDSNTWSDIYDFKDDQYGKTPLGGLTIGPNGNLWGTTFSGGDNLFWGTIYEFNYTDQTLQTRFSFDGKNGGGSTQALLLAKDQKFYSITANSGLGGVGTFFTFDPVLNQHTKFFDFNFSPYGANPYANMIQTKSGKFYGTTSFGGNTSDGVVYTFDSQSNQVTVLHHFNFADGSWPGGGLMEAQNGRLYGTTINGGSKNGGVIYEIDPTTDSFTKKFEFDWNQLGIPNGAFPWGRLTEMQNKLYGLTSHGGANQLGVIYEYDYTTEVLQPKFSFDGVASGSRPYGHLVDGGNGKLYGLTNQGGDGNSGTLFKFDPSSSYFGVVESFTGDNGSAPYGSLTKGADDFLYGMTETGGASNFGVLFTLDPATDAFAKRLDFPISGAYSFESNGSLTQSDNGKLYGLGGQGGDWGNGFVFEYDPVKNSYTKTADFNGTNGAYPNFSSLLFVSGAKQDQSIDFAAIPSKQFGDVPFQITATATSGLIVTFSTSDPAVATVNGSTVTIVGAGSVNITASQSGNSNYVAASEVQQTLIVKKASQSITFNSLDSKTFTDAAFDLTASSSSGLPVSFLSDNTSVATVNGSTVTIVGAGSANITASQTGNGNFASASDVQRTLTVNKANQSITFNSLDPKTFGDAAFYLNVSSTSGLPVSFSSDNTSVVTVSGSSVNIVGAGTVNITASQTGNGNYAAATDVLKTLVVNKATQSITFNTLDPKTFGDTPFDLVATSSSGLPVTFATSDPSLAMVSGTQVTISGEGHVTITAIQQGDNNFLEATSIARTFCVNPPTPVITVSNETSSTPLLTSSNISGNEWFLNGASITSDDHQMVAKTSGTYSVITTIDGCSSELSSSVAVTVTADNPFPEYVLNLYPNPVDDKLIITVVGEGTTKFSIEALDMSGKEVFQTAGFSNTPVEIDAKVLAVGVYILRLKSIDFIFTKKLIKK